MKRFLIVTILLLAVSSMNAPTRAQRPKLTAVEPAQNALQYPSAEAFSDGRGVWLRWETANERENLGFYVYRISGGQFEEIANQTLIAGAYLQARDGKSTSGTYAFFDAAGDAGVVYQIESYPLDGGRQRSNLIRTQAVKDLTPIAGASGEELIAEANAARPVSTENKTDLPKALVTEVEANRAAPDPLKQRWIAAQPGVKIKVRREGLYRVSRAELETAGFDLNSAPALWQLYANGIEQAINVGGNGDYIEFYGSGTDTPSADAQTYFLIAGTTNGKRIDSVFRNRIGASVLSSNYSQSFSLRQRTIYTSSVLNGDAENFFGAVISNTGATVNFNLSGIDSTQTNASIVINIQGVSVVLHQIRVVLNSIEIGNVTGANYDAMSKSFSIPVSLLREGANSLQLVSQSSGDVSFFNSLKVNFARKYRAEQKQLSFFVPNYKLTYVENFTSPNVRVFDTTNPDAPVLIKNLTVEQTGGTYRVVLPSNRSRVMFAIEDSAVMAADSVTTNQPSTLSTAAHNADLIIITHKNWAAQAEDWANYRRTQGLSVEVVNVDDIYDEFSYGILEPDAIKRFLQFAKSNWQTAPNYVLLLGDATYDPKSYGSLGAFNFVPTRLVDTIYMETGSDEALADFDNDGLAEIAVGRITARDAAGVTSALNKTVAFEQTVNQAFERGVVLASDLTDGYDFQALNNRLCEQLPATVDCTKINRGQTNSGTLLFSAINSGAFLVNYSGHGSTSTWSSSSAFFSGTQANQLTNANRLSVFTMLTCLNGYFFQSSDSLSEVLMKNPNGGSVANWASSGQTSPDVQEEMAKRFYRQIGTGTMTRVGDLVKDAKTAVAQGRDVRLSWVLLGDPALKVR